MHSKLDRIWKWKQADLKQLSVCIVSDWTIGIRSPAHAEDFSSSLCIQASSEVHPAFYPVGTGDPFLGVKRGRDVIPLILI
jgi:hypothetical protein